MDYDQFIQLVRIWKAGALGDHGHRNEAIETFVAMGGKDDKSGKIDRNAVREICASYCVNPDWTRVPCLNPQNTNTPSLFITTRVPNAIHGYQTQHRKCKGGSTGMQGEG